MSRRRIVIALAHDLDVDAWRARHARGEVLDRTPYGYDLASPTWDLAWTRAGREGRCVARVRRALAARIGFDLVHAWRNRALLQSADAIWTHTEREHLAVAAVVGRHAPPIIAQSVWLWDAWPAMGPVRRAVVRALLKRHAVELVHSRRNREISLRAVPGRRVALVPFGSSPAPHSAAAVEPGTVLAVGNDADRDWALLAAVAARMPFVRFRIASTSRAARRVAWPHNASLEPCASARELADALARAACVVVPLRPNLHASGTTSCIEAMRAARPLVVSDAGGIDDYVRGAARLVPPGERAALIRAIRAALDGDVPAPGPDVVRSRGLRHVDYVARYTLVTEAILGGGWDERISRFEPVSPAP